MADQPWWERGQGTQQSWPVATPAQPPPPPPRMPDLPPLPPLPPPPVGPLGPPATRHMPPGAPYATSPGLVYGQQPGPYGQPVLRPLQPRNPWAKALVRRKPPPEMRVVIGLLIANLLLTFVLTFVYFTKSKEIADHILRHYGFTDPRAQDIERSAYHRAATIRLIGNLVSTAILVVVVQLFLKGSMLAYWRTLIVSFLGIGSGAILLIYPYPHWFHIIVVVQMCVLSLLILSINQPAVLAHCRGNDYG